MYNVTLSHSRSGGQRKTANDNYNQHLKAKALRDTTMQTLRRLRRNGAEGPRLDPRLLGIQGPAVSFHLTRLPGHGCVGDGSL